MNRIEIIQSLINKHKYKSYLEIGVRNGECFNVINCEHKVGVDPDMNSRATIFKTSDDFFDDNKERYDIIFIDGLHHNDQVYQDITNSLLYLNEGGTIVMHDCLPETEEMQRIPLTNQYSWTGDTWKAFVDLRNQRSDLFMFVVDCDFGCGIITKGEQELITIPGDELSYVDFVQNKQEWMNIKSPEWFETQYIGTGEVLPQEITEVDVCVISFAKTEDLKIVTETAIESLLASEENIQFNIFVVESNQDITYDGYPNTKTIYTKFPFGYHRYLNLSRKMGKSEYVVLCNNDLTFEKGWASEIISFMEEDNRLLSASPFCPQTQHHKDFPLDIYYGYEIRKQLNGWCIFQKRKIYDIIGQLDEKFDFWYADNDYSMQLKTNGIKHGLITHSVVHHHDKMLGSTSQTILNDTEKHILTIGQEKIFNDKWYPDTKTTE